MLLGVAGLLVTAMALPWRRRQPMVITGDGAGSYELITYERHYFYWADHHGRRGVDTTFRVAYFSHARSRDGMLAEGRRIAPALWPVADRAGLTRLELKPTKALIATLVPVRLSYDLRFERQHDGTWAEVRHW